MKFHALVIDDDPDIQDDVRDRLESLGHTCDCVGSQDEAREHLRSDGYAYVLLDLEIPVRYGRKPRIINGQNLLTEIRGIEEFESTPVIVMTAHGLDGPDLAVEVFRDGQATDFVKKPFPSRGDTLEKRISGALKRSRRGSHSHSRSKPASSSEPKPFDCGELVFSKTRIELCGVKVCGGARSGMIRQILEALRPKNDRGHYVAYSGEELGDLVDCRPGQNGVAGAIRDFRRNVTQLLLEEANIEVGPRDVIQSGGRGYRLTEKILVLDADDPVDDLDHEPDHHADDPENDPDGDGLNERQTWIMEQVRAGVELRVGDLIAQFSYSKTTAKRDLTDLRERDLIVFEGSPRTGFWALRRSTAQAASR